MGRAIFFSPVKETRACFFDFCGLYLINNNKEDQEPQLDSGLGIWAGEWYSQFWQTKVVFFLSDDKPFSYLYLTPITLL